jgi:hypothetical protein
LLELAWQLEGARTELAVDRAIVAPAQSPSPPVRH